MSELYEPNWRSLKSHPIPQWFRDAKFGIYTHWGIYSVPACGPNVSWYPYNMYREGTPQHAYHLKHYGDPAKFGYKDFIPMFTGEKFDADEWAEIFHGAGAKFAGPVAEHHDGFAMWDTAYSEWNAARMGPKRNVVGELEKAIRGRDLKFMTAFHHAENWWFYPHWRKNFDTSDPQYAGLYGRPHNLEYPDENTSSDMLLAWRLQQRPDRAFHDVWKAKMVEVVEKYTPDLIWFDFGLDFVHEKYRQDFLAYYYNKEAEWNRGVVVTYKWNHLPPGTALIDLELGKMSGQTYFEWITDTTVDDGEGWGYMKDTPYKSSAELIHYLIDNVSKNGYMLLNVGPKPDGELPDEAKAILADMGRWLSINGEAIYGTVPWVKFGEGPTRMTTDGAFSDVREKVHYTGQDIRFTAKDNVLYAICLDWPAKDFTIKSLHQLYPGEVRSVQMLGSDRELRWQQSDDGLSIERPDDKPCDTAFTLKITRNDSL